MPTRKQQQRQQQQRETTAKSAVPESGGALRVAAYARYSSHNQDEGYSIEAQHSAILREAQHAEPPWIITWYDEPAQSAFKDAISERPVFAQLLDDVKAGQFDLVVVHRLDRWARNMRVSLDAVEQVLASRTRFMSVSEREFDFTSAAGWVQFQFANLFAEYYSRDLSVKTRGGKRERAQNGLHQSRPPFGYHAGASGVAEPDPQAWDGLRYLHALLLSGMTNMEAARAMNADGRWPVRGAGRGKRGGAAGPWSQEVVSQVRRNVFYRPYKPGDDRGTVTWQGEEYRGQHVAACTWDDWHTMREIASGRRRGRNLLRHEPYAAEFRGIVVCAGCGGRLYVTRSIGDGYTSQERYRCQRKPQDGAPCVYAGQWTRVEHVRAAWTTWARDHLRFPPSWEQDVRDAVLADNEQAATSPDELAAARERQSWKRKRERAKELYLADEIAREEWERRRREADDALARLAAAARGTEDRVTRLLDAGRLALNIGEYWSVSSTQERMQMAQLMIEPLGLVVRPLGYRGLYHRWQTADEQDAVASCDLVSVRLREPFRDLLAALQNAQDSAG